MEKSSPISLEYPVGLAFIAAILNLLFRLQKLSLGLLTFFHSHAKLHTPLLKSSSNSEEDFKLGREELEMVMGRMGLDCGQEGDQQLKEFWGSDEFSVMFEELEPSLEEVKMAFCVFDENKDGFIDAEDLQRVLSRLGFKEGMDLVECRRMIHACHGNKEKGIDFYGFVKFMESGFC
ncbi:hypothetical protein J5N97_006902 [Dioscorea zingiberensis]|uniref:EF-hand domain-containing protein n=1 Tax=Dioscorea zingiberensis TaxID=325984 RepID=A0A9D5HU06_9LILI|nr:hypothetical protein J5N97_006902 [Dioscorea zingiberensis]